MMERLRSTHSDSSNATERTTSRRLIVIQSRDDIAEAEQSKEESDAMR
jgi:hypothetical protein